MDNLICPITKERFIEPVNTLSGQTYELSALKIWMINNLKNGKFKDPVSGQLCEPIIVPNLNLKKIIEDQYPGTTVTTITTALRFDHPSRTNSISNISIRRMTRRPRSLSPPSPRINHGERSIINPWETLNRLQYR